MINIQKILYQRQDPGDKEMLIKDLSDILNK